MRTKNIQKKKSSTLQNPSDLRNDPTSGTSKKLSSNFEGNKGKGKGKGKTDVAKLDQTSSSDYRSQENEQ